MDSATPDSARKPAVSALRMALTSAVLFFLCCTTYILVSGYVAAQIATNVEQLKTIETLKGILFMAFTSLLFFGLAYRSMRRIERAEQLLRAGQDALMAAERRSLAGLFASSIAHDMRNIMTIVGVGIEDLRKGRTTLSQENVNQAFEQLNQLAIRLLNIGKEGMSQDLANVDLREILRSAVAFARSHPHIGDSRVAIHAMEPIPASASPHLLQLMVLNLMLNAAEATHGKGQIRVTLLRSGNYAEILVEDNGPGIKPDATGHLFTPFYTTKAGGTGLGLTSVKAVVQGHRGTIAVETSSLGGACFRVRLPLGAASRQ
ncbi:MAG TPA: HAMP domain-containing sensor histidine kinase [Kiritimatiellia bacterium]